MSSKRAFLLPTAPAPRASAASRGRLGVWVAGGLLAAAAIAAYTNSLSGPFVFDDVPSIVNNPTVRQLAGAWCPPRGIGLTVSGRPLLNVSFALNHRFSGLETTGYHILNLGIHLLAGLALFGIARRTLTRRQTPPTGSPNHRATAPLFTAFAIALLWMLHPLQTEAVTYIAQRAESLVGCWYLLTLYAAIRALDSPRVAAWTGVSVLACLLGMATKEVMVGAPLVVLLYDRTFAFTSLRAAWAKRRWLYAGLTASGLLLAGLVLSNPDRGGTAGATVGVTSWTYALTQFRAVVHYLQLAVWPHPLVFDYGTGLATRASQVWPQALLIAFLAGATLLALWRRAAAGFLGAWFFITLAPSSSVVPVATQTMAEHRFYLPLAAVVVLAVAGGQALLGPRSRPAWVVLALGLGCLTALRNHDYASEVALWGNTAARCPGNPRAHASLGNALAAAGQPEEAAAAFREALRLDPRSGAAHTGLGSLLAAQGRLPEAMQHYAAALQIHPDDAVAHYNLGNALVQSSRTAEAIDEFSAALRLVPNLPEAHGNLANALQQSGRLAEAVSHYEQALRLQPGQADLHFNLGLALVKLRRIGDARREFAESLRLEPDDAEAQEQLARLPPQAALAPADPGPR